MIEWLGPKVHDGIKSVDPKTSQASVELKVLIEQIREQVQNLE